MSTMLTSEVLDLTADLIEKEGWTLGSGWMYEGETPSGLCLEGGLMAALGMKLPAPPPITDERVTMKMLEIHPVWMDLQSKQDALFEVLASCPAYRAVYDYLEIKSGDYMTDRLYSWNDALSDDSQDRVIEVLRAAAVVERTKEALSVVTA